MGIGWPSWSVNIFPNIQITWNGCNELWKKIASLDNCFYLRLERFVRRITGVLVQQWRRPVVRFGLTRKQLEWTWTWMYGRPEKRQVLLISCSFIVCIKSTVSHLVYCGSAPQVGCTSQQRLHFLRLWCMCMRMTCKHCRFNLKSQCCFEKFIWSHLLLDFQQKTGVEFFIEKHGWLQFAVRLGDPGLILPLRRSVYFSVNAMHVCQY